MGRQFVTGRIRYTPEAEGQLRDLEEWITSAASAQTAQRFIRAVLGHIDNIIGVPSSRSIP